MARKVDHPIEFEDVDGDGSVMTITFQDEEHRRTLCVVESGQRRVWQNRNEPEPFIVTVISGFLAVGRKNYHPGDEIKVDQKPYQLPITAVGGPASFMLTESI